MKNEQIWTIIGIALVVVVISSVTSIYITGNVIKVKQDKTGQVIYTQKEVDSLLNDQKAKILTEVDKKIKNISFYNLNVQNYLGVGNMIEMHNSIEPYKMWTHVVPQAIFTSYDTINGDLDGEFVSSTMQGHGLAASKVYLDNGKQYSVFNTWYVPEGLYITQNEKNYFCGIINDVWACSKLIYGSSDKADSNIKKSCMVDPNNKIVCGKDDKPLAEIELQKSLALAQK